jgi:hypothetical protein
LMTFSRKALSKHTISVDEPEICIHLGQLLGQLLGHDF